MRRGAGFACLLPFLLLGSCRNRPAPVSATPQARFVLGRPYEAGGVWRYPRERYEGSITGLAVIQSNNHKPLTANGEVYDPQAMAAAHPTLQLPAIARLTDLETGRQVEVRINDRGPASPGRMLAVTPRVAALLGMSAGQPARVRLTLLPAESLAAADVLPGAPRLSIKAAPREAVLQQPLSQEAAAGRQAPEPVSALPADAGPPIVRLPGAVTRTKPAPGRLFVLLSPFTDRSYAVRQAKSVAEGRAQVVFKEQSGFVARLGPFSNAAGADAALDRAIRAGVTDARIVVE